MVIERIINDIEDAAFNWFTFFIDALVIDFIFAEFIVQ
jgi:hypothetical protein